MPAQSRKNLQAKIEDLQQLVDQLAQSTKIGLDDVYSRIQEIENALGRAAEHLPLLTTWESRLEKVEAEMEALKSDAWN
jgi:hypothetical protein